MKKRRCKICGSKLVSGPPNKLTCSEPCYIENRKQRRRRHWQRNAPALREKERKRYRANLEKEREIQRRYVKAHRDKHNLILKSLKELRLIPADAPPLQRGGMLIARAARELGLAD